jgi:lipoate-protein ligase B
METLDKKDLERIISRIEDDIIPVLDAGTVPYSSAFDIQTALAEKIRLKNLKGILILLEHPPVITIGSNRSSENLLTSRKKLEKIGIELFDSNRGGDITLHGPGQLVCYPIFNLGHFGKDLSLFVYNLEKVILDTLKLFGITGRRIKKHRGIFVEDKKIASIGLRVKKWVSIHGFSLNVGIDLSYFDHIVACGLKDFPQVSMSSLLGKNIAIDDVKEQIIKSFETVFDFSTDRTYF